MSTPEAVRRPPASPRPAVGAVTTAATWCSLALVLAALVASLLCPHPRWAQTVLVTGLLVGVPHGAVDHLLPAYRARTGVSTSVRLLAGYVALAGLAWVLIWAFPGPGLVAFLAVSAWHFGSGEATFAQVRAGQTGRRAGTSLLGPVVVLLPVLSHPSAVRPYLRAFAPGWSWVVPTWVAGAGTALLVAGALGLVVLRARRARWTEAVEAGLLVTLGLVATPAVSLGVYFGGWHSVRHIALLLAEDPANGADLGAGRLGPPLARFARQAAGPTCVVLGTLGALWTWSAHQDVHRFVATDLAVLAALTVPHAAAVWWLDRTRPATRSPTRTPGLPAATGERAVDRVRSAGSTPSRRGGGLA